MPDSSERLPTFKYFADPYGANTQRKFIESDLECDCCGRVRGYIYSDSQYSDEDEDCVCPWCIADGSAHQKYDTLYSICHKDSIGADEVWHRTPAVESIQDFTWPSHCGEACVFVGDADSRMLTSLKEPLAGELRRLAKAYDMPTDELISCAMPKGDIFFNMFQCRQCQQYQLHADMD